MDKFVECKFWQLEKYVQTDFYQLPSIGDIFGRYDYFITREPGFEAISYEYMPCLCPALNEDILRNDLLETIPDREPDDTEILLI